MFLAKNVFIGTFDTLSELPTRLFWAGRVPLDGRKSKPPTIIGTFDTWSELPTHLFWFGRAPLVGRNSKLPMGVGTSDQH